MERCQSGRMCTLGKRVYGNVPQVQILSFPPTKSRLIWRFFCRQYQDWWVAPTTPCEALNLRLYRAPVTSKNDVPPEKYSATPHIDKSCPFRQPKVALIWRFFLSSIPRLVGCTHHALRGVELAMYSGTRHVKK